MIFVRLGTQNNFFTVAKEGLIGHLKSSALASLSSSNNLSGFAEYERSGTILEVGCYFPKRDNDLVTSIRWFRRTYSRNKGSKSRFKVRQIGSNKSLLVVKDYRSWFDDGTYWCQAVRAVDRRKGQHCTYYEVASHHDNYLYRDQDKCLEKVFGVVNVI